MLPFAAALCGDQAECALAMALIPGDQLSILRAVWNVSGFRFSPIPIGISGARFQITKQTLTVGGSKRHKIAVPRRGIGTTEGRKRMKRRDFLKVSGVGLAASAVASPAIAQSNPEIKWRLAASWPKALDTLYGGCEYFCKRVLDVTDGKFQIQQIGRASCRERV